MSVNNGFAVCDTCGARGHRATSPRCPYRTSQQKMERSPKRAERIEIASDPALRDATVRTLFLGQSQ